MASISGYGVYVPKFRIKSREIARVWGEDPKRIEEGLGILQKSVPGSDEDTVTMAVEAGRRALRSAGVKPEVIGAVLIGSESHPYAVKPTASIVAEALGATPNCMAVDLEFACKAGSSGVLLVAGLVDSGRIAHGLAGGSDSAQGKPGDALEYSAGAGASLFVVSSEGFADIEAWYTFTTDTPDFWRREGQRYPSHGGRFTGEPAYFRHVIGAIQGLLEKTGDSLSDFDHFVFHQPNAKFPLALAKKLGIPKEKVLPYLIVREIGNTYSASSLIGLAAAFDSSKEGDRILYASFGSGASSDAIAFSVNSEIESVHERTISVAEAISGGTEVDYGLYLKLKGMLC